MPDYFTEIDVLRNGDSAGNGMTLRLTDGYGRNHSYRRRAAGGAFPYRPDLGVHLRERRTDAHRSRGRGVV